ncbi:hypothetical protein [Microbacterium sp.]|uniref:hypothetical protein n=1 Tax=Microbacterium sp. TaxID=51671 RepID=UPI003A863C5A
MVELRPVGALDHGANVGQIGVCRVVVSIRERGGSTLRHVHSLVLSRPLKYILKEMPVQSLHVLAVERPGHQLGAQLKLSAPSKRHAIVVAAKRVEVSDAGALRMTPKPVCSLYVSG